MLTEKIADRQNMKWVAERRYEVSDFRSWERIFGLKMAETVEYWQTRKEVILNIVLILEKASTWEFFLV